MRRRRFMDLAGASGWRRLAIIAAGWFALAIPSTAGAQPISRIPRIGYLAAVPTANTALLDALRAGLGTLDWVEGRNFIVEYRWSHERDELLPDLAADLVRLGVNLIVVPAATYAVAALRFTRTIPIVFCSHGDPVGAGHVASLARPGGNVTGVANLLTDLSTKQLEILVQAVPGARRIAVLWSPAESFHAPALPAVEAAARALQVEVRFVQVRGIEDFDAAFAQMSAEQVGAFLALVTPAYFIHRARLAELALRHRLPSVFGWREYPKVGGLISYNLLDMFRRCAAYVDKILKGASPAELPVEYTSRYEFVINLNAARSLGLDIPPFLLARADEVIE